MQCLVILLVVVSCSECSNNSLSLLLEPICFPYFSRPCLPTPSNSSKPLKTQKNGSEAMEINTWRPKSEDRKNSVEGTLRRSSNFNKQLQPSGADGYSLHANDFSNLGPRKDVERKFPIRIRPKDGIEVSFGNATKFLFAPKRKYEQKRISESAYKKDGTFVGNNEPNILIDVEGNSNISDIGEVFISENISSTKKLDKKNSSSEVHRSNVKYYVSEISFQKHTAGGSVKPELFSTTELFTEAYESTNFSEATNDVKVNESSIPFIYTTVPVTINDNENYLLNHTHGKISRLLIHDSKLHLKNMLPDYRSGLSNIRSRRFVEFNSNQTSCLNQECGISSKTLAGSEHNFLFKFNIYNGIYTSTTKSTLRNPKAFHAFKKLNYDNTSVLLNDRKEYHRRNLIFKLNKPFTYAEYSAKKTKLYPIESHPQFKEDLKSRPISDNSEMVVDEALKSYQTGTIAGDKVTDLLLRRNEGMSLEDDFVPRSSDELRRKKSELQIYEEKSFDKDSGALKMETGSGDQLRKGIREKRQNGKQYIYRRLNDLFGGWGNLEGSPNHTESLKIGKSLKKDDQKSRHRLYFAPIEQSSVQPVTLDTTQDASIHKTEELFISHTHDALQHLRNFSATGIKLNGTSPVSDGKLPMRLKVLQTLKRKENYPTKPDHYNENKINKDILTSFQSPHFNRNTLKANTAKNSIAIDTRYNRNDSLSSLAFNTLNSRKKRQSVKISQNKNNVKNGEFESPNQNRRWEDALVLVIDKSALPIAVRTQKNDYSRNRSHNNRGIRDPGTRFPDPGIYQHVKSKDNFEVVTSNILEYRDKPRYLSGLSISNSNAPHRTPSRPKGLISNANANIRQNLDNGGRWKKVGITSVANRNHEFLSKLNDPQVSAPVNTDISSMRPKSRLKSWFETKVLKEHLKSSKNTADSNGNVPSEIWYIILPIEKNQENPNNDSKKEPAISGSKRASLQPKKDEFETQIASQRELESEDSDYITRLGPHSTTYRTPTYIYPKNKFIYTISRGAKRNKPNLQQFERYVEEDQLEATNDTEQRGFLDWFNRQWGFVTPTESTPVEKSTKDPYDATTRKPPNNQLTTSHPDFQLTVKSINYKPATNDPNTQPMEEEERKNRYTTHYTEERHTTTKASNKDEIHQENATKQPDILQSTNMQESIQSRKARPSKIPGNKLTTKSSKRLSTTKSTTQKPHPKTTMKPIAVYTTKKPESIVNKPVTYDPWWNNAHDPWWNGPHDPWWNRPHDPWWNDHNKKPWKKPIPCSKGFVPNNPWKIWMRPWNTMNKHGMRGGD